MSSLPRVAILTSSLSGGGAEKMMLTICRGLLERGYDVDFIVVHETGEYIDAIPEQANFVSLDASRELFGLVGLVRYLRREKPPHLLATGTSINLLAVWATQIARTNTNVVIRVQTTLSWSFENRARVVHRVLPGLIWATYPAADQIVANSNAVADDVTETTRAAREDVRVIHNPTVTEELFKSAKEPVELPWEGDFDGHVLVTAGRLVPEKDFSTLLRAVAAIETDQAVRLLILGKGERRTALERLADDLGIGRRVTFLGFVDNPYPYLRAADLFLLSSKWEGLPNVLIEALSCETQVVATNCPGGPSEILEDSEHGTLVPVGDPEALARGIETELDTERDPTALRDRAMDFSLEAILPEYEALFR